MSNIQNITVLGAGVMGAQIAAQFVNCGYKVTLLDLASADKDPSIIAKSAIKKLIKSSPPALYYPELAKSICPGNFDSDFPSLNKADLIIEAVIEDLKIKQNLWSQIIKQVAAHTILATNTSGIPLKLISQNFPAQIKQRFMGIHFFNPPRYQRLLELIPSKDTAPHIIEKISEMARIHLGKGIVVAKDTPNFIGNRIGCYAMQKSMIPLFEDGFSIAEIDAMTGPLMGRPKSATFRTLDLVGVDTILYVASNLHKAILDDECRNEFIMPTEVKKMVKNGLLGAKVKKGFYSKVNGQIKSIDFKTMEYQDPQSLTLENIKLYSKIPRLEDRLKSIYHDTGRIGQYMRKFFLNLLSYSARRIPEITDSCEDIDKAMRWGWAWQMGPFEIWRCIGFGQIIQDRKEESLPIPQWVLKLDPKKGFKNTQKPPKDEFFVKKIRKRLLKDFQDAKLYHWKRGICLFEFTGKANTISSKVLHGLIDSIHRVEADPDMKGILIANDSQLFSAGANLAEMAGHVMQKNFAPIEEMVRLFQEMSQTIHYAAKPVIPVAQGRALGGACEILMAAPHVVAAHESYFGLVELGVGLIPAGAGSMRMAKRASQAAVRQEAYLIEPFLRKNWQTIAMAEVSASSYDAVNKNYLNAQTVHVANSYRRIHVAAQVLEQLSEQGYRPPRKELFTVLGKPAAATFNAGAYNMLNSHFISKYDYHLATRLAHIMTGGELSHASQVSEEYILDLEREVFLSLLSEPKTLARVESILKFNRPLRN